MSVIGRIHPAQAPASSADTACRHCGLPALGEFCCHGCAAAHALVSGLGLDAFYRRSTAAIGALRPDEAVPLVALAPHATQGENGTWRLELMLAGLSCGACVWLAEQALAAEPDILRARASLTARRLSLAWRGDRDRAEAFAALLARLGLRAVPATAACMQAADDAETRSLTLALGIAAFGAMNVMLVSVAVWVGDDMGEATRAAMHWLAALIGLPTIMLAGLPFYRSALAGLRAGRANMDLAISLAVLATAAMSLSETLRNGAFTWFDGATTLLALLLAGRLLDRRARARAGHAVAELLALGQGSVRRLAADGTTTDTTTEAMRLGDRLLLASGERLGLDATVEADGALFDLAATTGESFPRDVARGGLVLAGAVNMGAPVVLRVAATAADGSLAATARLLETASQARGKFMGVADRAARFYVPVVHAVAALTFLGWWLGPGGVGGVSWQAALVPAVAALIITCPCGLAIAVPAVQVVAVGALFRRGVLVASSTALERLAAVDHVLLDKTGTLTEGHPRLLTHDATPEALRLAAGMARASRHPLAVALAAACPEAPLPDGVREVPGQGLVAGAARLGQAGFVGHAGAQDSLTLHFAAPGLPPARFRFADTLRPDAAEAVSALRALGLGVELVSGDAAAAVAEAAQALGIDRFQAHATPEDKAARVQELQAQGHRVLMLGDGINDAPALALAHASATPPGATDLAQTNADIVLRGSGLAQLAPAIRLARRSQLLSRQNIAASLAYNLVAVPLAVLGLVTPLLAATVMATSSLGVILNALRAGHDPAGRAP
jgi:Cu2+-exporting ATPase